MNDTNVTYCGRWLGQVSLHERDLVQLLGRFRINSGHILGGGGKASEASVLRRLSHIWGTCSETSVRAQPQEFVVLSGAEI